MAKYYGYIGYGKTYEEGGSTWEENIIEKPARGDILKSRIRNDTTSEQLLDDFHVNEELSIVADAFAIKNFHRIKYVTLYGAKWKVTSATVNFPRLSLTIGGLYHGPEPDEDEAADAGCCF